MQEQVRSFLSHDWTKVFAIIVTLVGIAVAFEHRITIAEATINDIQSHKTEDVTRFEKIENGLSGVSINSLKQSIILDSLEKRMTALELKKR
jgi:DNA-binding transcriptional regulator YdaS (Cro superfamily)